MSRRIAIAIMTVLGPALLISCATSPATKDEGVPSRSDQTAVVSPDPAVPVDSAGAVDPAGATDAAESAAIVAARDSDGTVESAPMGERGLDASPQTPETPAEERLLYFYPEPELSIASQTPAQDGVIPAEKPDTPKADKPATPQIAVPKSPQVPKSAGKPAIVPKPDTPVSPRSVEPSEKPPVYTQAEKSGTTSQQGATNALASIDGDTSGDEGALPGIWLPETEGPSPAVPETARPAQPPSRSATIPAGHTLEVWYPGSGWVYLGDASAQNGLSYQTRKLEGEDTLFSFRAMKPGSYILEFSRFDVLGDTFVSDSLAVTVNEPVTERTGRIRSPDYRSSTAGIADKAKAEARVSVAPDSPALRDEPSVGPASAPGTVVPPVAGTGTPTDTGGTPVLDPEQILEKTRSSLASGDAAGALALLDDFFAVALTSLDEGWFLRGQSYEANGPAKNIRRALSAYETLVSAFPDSARWQDADARIRYIKQFYFRIR